MIELRPGPGRRCPDDELCAHPGRCEMGAGCPDVQELSHVAIMSHLFVEVEP